MKYYKLFFFILVSFLLIIPLFHMNTAEITEQENRTLAKFPEIKRKNKPNYEFGKEFETWLGDRFWGRDQLLDARFQTIYKINGRIENDKAFVGDDGWMFMKKDILDVPSIENQKKYIDLDANIIKKFNDKFNKKNIPIYLVIVPDRNQLYQEYWERYYTPKQKLDYGEEMIKALKDYPNIKVIYLKKEFMKNKELVLYKKNDSHYSANGVYTLFSALVYSLNLNIIFPNINAIEILYVDDLASNTYISDLLGIHTEKRKNKWITYKKIHPKNKIFNKLIIIGGNCRVDGLYEPFFSEISNNVLSCKTNRDDNLEKERNNCMDIISKFMEENIYLTNKDIIIIDWGANTPYFFKKLENEFY